MARRLPSSNSDSLELLLDTMCNTFGGIILIALLIALLARDVKVTQEEDAMALKTQMTQRRLQKARDDLTNAQHHHDRLVAANPDIEKRRRLMEEKNAKLHELANLSHKPQAPGPPVPAGETSEKKAQTLQEKIGEQTQQEAQTKGEISDVEGSIKKAEAEISQTKSHSKGRAVRLRLPREHTTGKDAVQVILRHRQVYPLFYLNAGQPSKNEAGLTWKPMEIGGLVIGHEVQPIPGRGLAANNVVALQQWMRGFPSARFDIVFFVYEDSFAEFQLMKQFVTGKGFEYGWQPRVSSDVLRFGSGGASTGIQ